MNQAMFSSSDFQTQQNKFTSGYEYIKNITASKIPQIKNSLDDLCMIQSQPIIITDTRIIKSVVYINHIFNLNQPLIRKFTLDEDNWYINDDEYNVYVCGDTIEEAKKEYEIVLYESFLHFSEINDDKLTERAKKLKKNLCLLFNK